MATNNDFWYFIDLLTAEIRRNFELYDDATEASPDKEQIERQVIEKSERIVEDIVKSLVAGEAPVLRIPRGSKSNGNKNIGSTLVSLGSARGSKKFNVMLNTLAQAHNHVLKGTYATRRDVYYENVALYHNQGSVDRAVEDLAKMLEVPRHALHLTTTSKGLVGGSLTYKMKDGLTVNVHEANAGMMVPEGLENLVEVTSEAKYILVIEKDATFQKFMEAQVHRSYGPAILVTGKGYPDVPTRQFLYRLWRDLKIPVLALTDADPYGLHIAAVYKFGAMARDEPGLSINSLAWLGILPSDLPALQLPAQAMLPMTPKDFGKLASLAAHPAISTNEKWMHEIKVQQQLGKKAEIQGLTHIKPDYLTTMYLPRKLCQGGWID